MTRAKKQKRQRPQVEERHLTAMEMGQPLDAVTSAPARGYIIYRASANDRKISRVWFRLKRDALASMEELSANAGLPLLGRGTYIDLPGELEWIELYASKFCSRCKTWGHVDPAECANCDHLVDKLPLAVNQRLDYLPTTLPRWVEEFLELQTPPHIM